MFSIIISSINKQRQETIAANIAATAGASYELLLHKNKQTTGLCEVYNSQAAKAKYGLLCFVHEDVLFHTQNWCERIAQYLQTDTVGVVGIMGARYKSYFGAGWRDGDAAGFRLNVKDGAEDGRLLIQNPKELIADEVICLDGAFLCCTKAHWQQHPFDEKNFSGFHFYDLDFCLQMHAAGLQNLVTYEVMIEHFSQGKRDNNFLRDFLQFQRKWKTLLPQTMESLRKKTIENLEGYALAETLALMKRNGFSRKERWRQLATYRLRNKRIYHVLRSLYFGFLK